MSEGLFPTPPRAANLPQVVERGEGARPYRARKPPEAITAHLCGFGPGILVLRCHNGDVALEAIGRAVDAGTVPADLAHELVIEPGRDAGDDEVEIDTAAQIWVRYVPELNERGVLADGPGSYERELRGTAGATPAVLFAQPNPANDTRS